MTAEPALRFRLDPKTRRLLDRLRDERHVNISSWARKHIQDALRAEFPDEFPETADETPEPQAPEPQQQPIPGWRPRKIGKDKAGKDEWGAALKEPDVARLPKELHGIQITVTAATTGKSWTGTIEEVVSRSEDLVVVRLFAKRS